MQKFLLQGLLRRALTEQAPIPNATSIAELGYTLGRTARQKLGRSLSIREVDAGSCNGCELEIHALNNAYYDLERFRPAFRRVAASRRRLARHRTGDEKHARSA